VAVYVDDASIPAAVPNGQVVHDSRWSHLWADTDEELHAFATRLGLRRSYHQPAAEHHGFSHYDVTTGKRWQAIRLGAQAVSWRDAAATSRERRQAEPERSAWARRHGQGRIPDPAPLVDQPQLTGYLNAAAAAAHKSGQPGKALRLLNATMAADPARAAKAATHRAAVLAVARARGQRAAGPADTRPLAQVVDVRLEAAGIGPYDHGLQFARAWNAQRSAEAEEELQPDPGDGVREPDPEPLPELEDDAQPEAGS
jgi:Protein of unknown function (DUF4031)